MCVFAGALVITASTAAWAADKSGAKKIKFTTSSKEAIASVEKIVHSIESFQPPAQWLPEAKRAIEADPQFAFGHYLLATGTLPAPEAREIAEKAVELAKNASEGERRYIEAVLLARSQQTDKAAAIFEDLAKEFPDDRMVAMMLGQVSMIKGDIPHARSAFERAIRLDGSTPRAYTFLGNIELVGDDYEKARRLFTKSIERKAAGTVPVGALYGVAFSQIYEGKVDAALNTLYALRDEYEKSPGARTLPSVFIWNSIGRLLLESGRAEESLKAYEKGYKTVPGSELNEQNKQIWLGRFHHGRARALAKMGRHQEAWKEAELIKKMIDDGGEQGQPFLPAYHYVVGYLKLEAGDYAKAIEHLKQSDQTDPFQKLLLARAYEKSGDRAAAKSTYKEILGSTQATIERALAYGEAKKKAAG